MNNWSFYDRVAALVPFELKGYHGKVAIYYGVNDDPIEAGFDSIAGLNFDIQLCRGYPVIHARIEDYAGSGYRTFCGWIQIVTSVYLDSRDRQKARAKTFVSVDLAPAIQESDVPFAAYGNLPELFDAPCLNLGEAAELRWTADTFLTTVPARSREEEIAWLLGFRWGYVENDIPGEQPVLLPLEVTGAGAWNQHVDYLRKEYSRWRFK
jgi:hypothetical protein